MSFASYLALIVELVLRYEHDVVNVIVNHGVQLIEDWRAISQIDYDQLLLANTDHESSIMIELYLLNEVKIILAIEIEGYVFIIRYLVKQLFDIGDAVYFHLLSVIV